MSLRYIDPYNSNVFPDNLNQPYIADPDEGGLIHVDVSAPYLDEAPKPVLWPWILAGLALLLLAGNSNS